MSRLAAIVFVIWSAAIGQIRAQSSVSPTAEPNESEKIKPKAREQKASPDNSNPLLKGLKGAPIKGPVTTEIHADDAFFDSNKNVGIFSGHVKVADPRFTLQAEKLTVHITKGENQGLEKVIAEGNVAVVRERPDTNGGTPTRAVGRADEATYVATTGNVELRGSPRVQEGVNTHVGTSPDTVMIVNQNGQLTTHGPSRTEIRQQLKADEGEKKKEEKSPAAPIPSNTP